MRPQNSQNLASSMVEPEGTPVSYRCHAAQESTRAVRTGGTEIEESGLIRPHSAAPSIAIRRNRRPQNLGLFFSQVKLTTKLRKGGAFRAPFPSEPGEIRDHSSCKTWILARSLSSMICAICRAIDQLSNAGVALLPA